MKEFFNNSDNDSMKFKLNVEGVNINKIEPRLLLTTNENKNYFFVGKIKGDVCEFNIPELSLYEKNENGNIKFEIISEDLYFPVWKDDFKIVTKASVKIEEMMNSEPIHVKPKITTQFMEENDKKLFETTKDIKKENLKMDRLEKGVHKKDFLSFNDFNTNKK